MKTEFLDKVEICLYCPEMRGSKSLCRIISLVSEKKYSSLRNICTIIYLTIEVFILFLPVVFLRCATGLFSGCVSLFDKKTFTEIRHISSETKEKEKAKTISLLTWNVCALPGGLPTIFGGVLTADKRVAAIADLIQKTDSDIVCLQEAHDKQFSYELTERLKNTYSRFFFDIGKNPFSYNSGLFVAMKGRFAVTQPEFIPFTFPGCQRGVNKGIFTCIISTETGAFNLGVTHLQPHETDKDRDIRLQELKLAHQILSALPDNPKILCGDLNIHRGSGEKGETFFKTEYMDATPDIAETATDGLHRDLATNFGSSIDYGLIKNEKGVENEMTGELIETYSLQKPDEALSDHHALLLKINLLN